MVAIENREQYVESELNVGEAEISNYFKRRKKRLKKQSRDAKKVER